MPIFTTLTDCPILLVILLLKCTLKVVKENIIFVITRKSVKCKCKTCINPFLLIRTCVNFKVILILDSFFKYRLLQRGYPISKETLTSNMIMIIVTFLKSTCLISEKIYLMYVSIFVRDLQV